MVLMRAVHGGAGAPQQLYQVLEQQQAAVGTGLMGSDHTYRVPAAGDAQLPPPPLRKCASPPWPTPSQPERTLPSFVNTRARVFTIYKLQYEEAVQPHLSTEFSSCRGRSMLSCV